MSCVSYSKRKHPRLGLWKDDDIKTEGARWRRHETHTKRFYFIVIPNIWISNQSKLCVIVVTRFHFALPSIFDTEAQIELTWKTFLVTIRTRGVAVGGLWRGFPLINLSLLLPEHKVNFRLPTPTRIFIQSQNVGSNTKMLILILLLLGESENVEGRLENKLFSMFPFCAPFSRSRPIEITIDAKSFDTNRTVASNPF